MEAKFVGLTLLILCLTSCATKYQPDGFTGGVSAVQLNESMFEVRSRGNAAVSEGKIKDFALLKSAELCRENGFTHFIPVSEENTTETGTLDDNSAITNCYGSTCYTSGGGSYSYSKPRTSMTVKMFNATEEIPSTAYSCLMIFNNLAPKYIQ